MSIKLIATDMDGTMLYDYNTVSPRNAEVIARARQKGVKYALATGRCIKIIPFEQLPPVDYLILDNGAEIRDGQTGEVIYAAFISEEGILKMIDAMADMPVAIEFFVDGMPLIDEKLRDNLDFDPFHRHLIAAGDVTIVPDLREYVAAGNARVTKINVLVSDMDKFEEIGSRLRAIKDYELANGNFWYELTGLGQSKGPSLVRLAEHLGIDMSEVAAFGDGPNDVTMLRVAGYGVAMGNSSTDAFEAANCRTLTNMEDGIAVFLEEQFGL